MVLDSQVAIVGPSTQNTLGPWQNWPLVGVGFAVYSEHEALDGA